MLQLVTMTALSLLLMAVSAASVLAESTVYYREQFEDGGEVLHTKLYCHYVTVFLWFAETVTNIVRNSATVAKRAKRRGFSAYWTILSKFLIHCLLIAQLRDAFIPTPFIFDPCLSPPLPSIPASPFVHPSYHQTLSVPHPPAAHLSPSLSPPSPYCLVFTYSVESAVIHIMHVPAVQHSPSAPALMHHQRWIRSLFTLTAVQLTLNLFVQMPGRVAGWNPSTSQTTASLSWLQGSSMEMQTKTKVSGKVVLSIVLSLKHMGEYVLFDCSQFLGDSLRFRTEGHFAIIWCFLWLIFDGHL